jgi:D-alanyl-D-alanine carboxypeptidase
MIEKFEINVDMTDAKVSREAVNLGGTTANFKYGDIVNLKDLFYGMMLPSGNDAAFCIAEYFGKLLYKKSPEYEQKLQQLIKM